MEITNDPQTSPPPPPLAVSKEGSNLICSNGEVFLSEFRSADITATHENTPSGRELFVDFRCAIIMAPWTRGKVLLGYVDGSKYSLTLEEEEHLSNSNSSNQLGQMLILHPKRHPSSIAPPPPPPSCGGGGVQFVVHKSCCFHLAEGGDEDGRIPIYVRRVSKGGKAELFIQAISNSSTPNEASAALKTETIEFIDRKWARDDERERTPFASTPSHSLSPPQFSNFGVLRLPKPKLNVGESFHFPSKTSSFETLEFINRKCPRNAREHTPVASTLYYPALVNNSAALGEERLREAEIPKLNIGESLFSSGEEWRALIDEQSKQNIDGGVILMPKLTSRHAPNSPMELPDEEAIAEYLQALATKAASIGKQYEDIFDDVNIVPGNSSTGRHKLFNQHYHPANDIEDTHMTSSAASVIQLHGSVLAGAAYNDPITTIQKHFKQKIDGYFEHWPSSSSPPESIMRITQAAQEIEGLLLRTSVNDYSYSKFLEDSEPHLQIINEEVNKMFEDNTGSLTRHLLCEYLHLRFAHMFAKFHNNRSFNQGTSESLLRGNHNEVALSSSFNIRPFIQGIIRKSRDLLLLMGEKVHDEIVVGYVSDIVQSFMSENMNQVGQSVFPPMQKVLYGFSISCLISSWMLRPSENENTASSSSTRSRSLRRNELSCMMRGLWLVVALLRFFSILFAPLPFAYAAIAVFACIILVLAPGLYSLES